MSTYFFETSQVEQDYLQSAMGEAELNCVPWPLESLDQVRGDADAVTVLSVFVHSRVTRQIIEALPNLRLIATRSTGFNHIDLAAAAERGIVVCNVPGYGVNTVAEHVFALLLALSHRMIPAANSVQGGYFDPTPFQGFDLKGRTLGVIGTGRIGLSTLAIGKGFGMNLLGCDAFPDESAAKELGVTYRSLQEILAESDVISLHTPLLPTTQHMMNREAFVLMKPGSVFINTSRGELVDTDALAEAVEAGKFGGVGLDVLEYEERLLRGDIPEAVQRLLGRPDVIITPHSAYNTYEAITRILATTVETIREFEQGAVTNQVKLS